MKRIFTLSSLLVLGHSLFAQNLIVPTQSIGQGKVKPRTETVNFSQVNNFKKDKPSIPFFPASIGNRENVGPTTYDLQTNGAMQRRVLQMGNKISCFWTMSTEADVNSGSAFNDRGTGYAHFDGTNWSATPSSRIETFRTGFSSAFINGNGEESYVAHGGSNNTIYLANKTGTSWNVNPSGTSIVNAPIWAHAASSGNWLYVIGSPLDSNVHANGIRNGYFFGTLNDNGATWIDDMIPMPLIDTIGHYRGGGNSYAIAANGSHVAVLCGDMGTDLTLMSSSDYGATWSKKIVFDWPLNHFDFASMAPTDTNADGIADTLNTNDGSHTLALDNAGVAHIAFPIVRVYKSGTSTGYGFFLTTSLAYYNTIADSLSIVDNIFASYHDCDGDNSFGIGINYASSLAADPDAIYNTIGTITQPSITVVNSNPQKILISYTAIMDNDTTVDDGVHQFWQGANNFPGQNYRDVFVVGTKDSGASWTYPVNVTKTAHFEEAFVSTPESITGDNLPILYQGDIEPGTILQNEDEYEVEYENAIILHNVSVDGIFTAGLDATAPCGQSELPLGIKHVLNKSENVAHIFPNPTGEKFQIKMTNSSLQGKYELKIYDLLGKAIQQQEIIIENGNSPSISTLNIPTGLYSIVLSNDHHSFSLKLNKQ